MRHAPLLLSFLFTLPLCASVACSSKTSTSSGASSHEDWTRGVTISSQSTVSYALGEHAHVTVMDQLSGPTVCSDSSGCGGPSCSTPTEPTNSTVESVTCEGACLATAALRAPGTFDIDVIGRDAGPARVVIRLRDEKGEVRVASATVTFARATHIGISRVLGDAPHGTTYAALPGASFTWCSTLDADGAPLELVPENIAVAVTGATVQHAGTPPRWQRTGRCDSFVAVAPGEIDVTMTYRDLVRREKVRVVDPSDVKAVELLELGQALDLRGIIAPIENDPLQAVRPAKLVDLAVDDCNGAGFPFLQRLTLWDGTYALAEASSLTVTPTDLLAPVEAFDHATIARFVPEARGAGLFVADVGAAHVEVPVTVSGSCLPRSRSHDAGDAADSGDAGTADAAEPDASADDGADASTPP